MGRMGVAATVASGRVVRGRGSLFFSTFERQLDAKRRIVLPQEFRTALPMGAICFPSFEADCLEGGGQALLDRYEAMIEELAFGDELRNAIEDTVSAGRMTLTFDTAGRITLPEHICERFGLTDWVCVVGLRERFQIWNREAYYAHSARMREKAREGLAALRAQQRGKAS